MQSARRSVCTLAGLLLSIPAADAGAVSASTLSGVLEPASLVLARAGILFGQFRRNTRAL